MVAASFILAGAAALAALLIFIAGLYTGWRFGRASIGQSVDVSPPVYPDPGSADIDECSPWDAMTTKEGF